MPVQRYVNESRLAAPPREVFAYFERPDAFSRLIPPGQRIDVVQPPESLRVGTRVVVRMHLGPIPIEWTVEHVEYIPDRLFIDRQVKGPFASWVHRHEFEDDGRGGTILRDVVDYEPPMGMIGTLIGRAFLDERLEELFDYRHRVIREAVERGSEAPEGSA